jgi:LacI family transcriptional regulator
MATLKDISRLSGISVTQVSRALNGHSDVNAETRQHVQEVADSLNYSPNITARKLVSGRSGMVALVSPQFKDLTNDRTFIESVTGLSTQFSRRGMQFVLHIPDEGDTATDVYGRLIDGGALDGFVIIEPEVGDPRIKYLIERDVPFVVHGRTYNEDNYPYFDIDNYGVLHKLTKHLIDQGHTNIGFINGREELNYCRARLEGFHDALAQADLTANEEFIFHGWMTEPLGLVSTIQMFSGSKPHPTALICGNILIANGVYSAAKALGLKIPADLSVVAHDDVVPHFRASAFYPALTVSRSPLKDSWIPLADSLSAVIDGTPVEKLQKIAGFEFVDRDSVAKISHKSNT